MAPMRPFPSGNASVHFSAGFVYQSFKSCCAGQLTARINKQYRSFSLFIGQFYLLFKQPIYVFFAGIIQSCIKNGYGFASFNKTKHKTNSFSQEQLMFTRSKG